MTEKVRPTWIALDAWGDLDGQGEWTITPRGPLVRARHDWRVRADKPLIRHLSFLFQPVFSANHRWAMARGVESLKVELVRRRAGPGAVSEPLTAGGRSDEEPAVKVGILEPHGSISEVKMGPGYLVYETTTHLAGDRSPLRTIDCPPNPHVIG